MKRFTLATALLLVLASCGGDTATTSTAAPAETTGAPPATVTPTSVSTTTPATTSTTEVVSTTVAATTTTTPPFPLTAATPTLADGRPATFVAITEDFLAVEVDTLSGEIIHTFGQTGTLAQVNAAEEMPPNVLVGVWRVRSGAAIGLSDCCEPAAGILFLLEAGETLSRGPYTQTDLHGWSLSPSPVDDAFASTGYSSHVFDPLDPTAGEIETWIDDPALGFPNGVVAWTRDGSQFYWTTQLEQVTALATLSRADGEPSHVTVLSWVGVHQYLDGIGTQAGGNLVGFLHTSNDGFETIESQGVVFSESGELLANFPVEPNSLWGGYDQSGRFLIYVDGEDTVRWQGLGQSGSLAAGYIFASW